MLRLIFACAFAILFRSDAVPAADLPAQTRLGAIFAEPVAPRVHAEYVTESHIVYAPQVDVRRLVNGYYGKPNSYFYSSYYGTPPDAIFGRPPYACGSYGYC